jgi:hypothetical protein
MAARAATQPVSDHYLSQAGLILALRQALRALWADLNGTDVGSLLRLRARAAVLVDRFALASASMAARNYDTERAAAGVLSSFTVALASGPDAEQVAKSLSWATRNLQVASPPSGVIQQAELDMEAAARRLVLNTGRQTTVQAVQDDRRARAWAREARPDCCAFCAMLASRGPVYKTEATASLRARDGQSYHDHCHCQPVPVFGQYEPTAHARQWTADWQNLKRENGGSLSLNQWRRHIEGRPTTDDPHLAGN